MGRPFENINRIYFAGRMIYDVYASVLGGWSTFLSCSRDDVAVVFFLNVESFQSSA